MIIGRLGAGYPFHHKKSFSNDWADWFAWANIAVAPWTRMFERAKCRLSVAISASRILLLADVRLTSFVCNRSRAK